MKNKTGKVDFLRIFSNKSFVIPFSIICAFIIWIVISVKDNPTREQVFTDVTANISVENTAVSEMGLGIVSDLSKQKFTVTVKGPNYIVSSLKSDDFTITADVTDVNAPGTYNLNLIGNRNSSKSGYSFVSISPASVDVTFDYIDTKEFTLAPKLIGVSAADGLVAETPVVSNSAQSTITVKGPRSIMEKIDSVGSVAEVNKTLDKTQTFDSYVVLYDASGKILYRYTLDGKVYDANDNEIADRRLTLSYTSLKVTQPISRRKLVGVQPNFTNVPEGIDINSLSPTVDHQTVTVIGTPDVVDKMTVLNLTAIDFRNISSTANTFEISPNMPDGVKLVDSIEYFTVKVDTEKFADTTFTVSDVRFTNVGTGLTARKNSSIKNVKICGPKDVIALLSSSDIYATVDLKDKTAGEYTVEVKFVSTKYNNIWAVGDYKVSVTLR